MQSQCEGLDPRRGAPPPSAGMRTLSAKASGEAKACRPRKSETSAGTQS